MMRLAFPEYNSSIVSGIRLDTEEARKHYAEKFDVSSNVEMATTIASYTSANNLTNYLVSTFKGGGAWLIYKKTNRNKKAEKKLKFWAAINSIPILGNISEIHDAITELGIILPQQWQSELRSYGSKMYKDGKVNPLLPTLLSVRNGRNEPILTKYAYTLGVLSENSNDHFPKYLVTSLEPEMKEPNTKEDLQTFLFLQRVSFGSSQKCKSRMEVEIYSKMNLGSL